LFDDEPQAKRRHVAQQPCPHCARDGWGPDQCLACGLHGCLYCIPRHYLGTDHTGQHCCAANASQCGACGVVHLNVHAAQHQPLGLDGAGQPCCAANGAQCQACGGAYRHGAAHVLLGNDHQGRACCAANSANCQGCGALYRTQDGPPHAYYGLDGKGQHCCAANAVTCPCCATPHRNADPAPHPQYVPACGHGTGCALATCAKCLRCTGCAGALTIDVCATCLTVVAKVENHATIRQQPVPGYAATSKRQLFVSGTLHPTSVGDRKTPPPSLSSHEVDGDIGEMKQYDRGHIIALELGGFDHKRVIAPMNFQFNRSGKWRTMETTIGSLLGQNNAQDVNGAAVPALPAQGASPATLTLGAPNVLNTVYTMEVSLFYDDVRGDTRVPVWFYVRLFRNRRLVTHFSLANRCDKLATMPTRDEMAEFAAATAIFNALGGPALQAILLGTMLSATDDEDADEYLRLKSADLGAEDAEPAEQVHTDLSMYVIGNARPTKPPNQLLQFMWEVNQAATKQGVPQVFATMELTAQGSSKAYDGFQRRYLRAFNRWKNAGALRSDALGNLYEGETDDIWANLEECGGRAAPEVDHVFPSYQQGANSYMNARLVSFQHNHMYREKKTNGAEPVSTTLLRMFHESRAIFMNRTQLRWARGENSWCVGRAISIPTAEVTISVDDDLEVFDATAQLEALYGDDALFDAAQRHNLRQRLDSTSLQYELMQARQTFLQAAAATLLRQQKETALDEKYTRSTNRHANALRHFIDSPVGTHPGRVQLKTLIDAAGVPLCAPSDVLLDTGGLVNAAAADTFPLMPDPTIEAAYTAAINAMNVLKNRLGI
jgi:hypothetical protein